MDDLHTTKYDQRGLVGWLLVVLIGLFAAIFAHSLLKKGPAPGYIAAAAPLLTDTDTRELQALNREFAALAKAVTPAVVNISTTRVIKTQRGLTPLDPFMQDPFFRRFFGPEFFGQIPRERREHALGSGVIVGRDGLIVTNNHVIEQASEIKILLPDKRSFVGKKVGADPGTDVALLRIDAKNLPALPWGDSDRLQVGESVIAVGNPFGLNQTVTRGIISAVGRTEVNLGGASYANFIQTDAAINQGNSGGALVNIRGELIGLNTVILSPSGGFVGIGFAIPSQLAKQVMTSLLQTGKVVRGWLGVSIQEITPELASQFNLKDTRGALVGDVTPNSPAEQAGLKSGDVIVDYNGKLVSSATDLRFMVAETPVGNTVPVRILRQGREQSVRVRIGELPKELAERAGSPEFGRGPGPGRGRRGLEPGEYNNPLKGLAVESLTPEIARRLGIRGTISGVVVAEIDPASEAGAAGIQQGDVIMEVNRQRVTSAEDYDRIARSLRPNASVLLRIYRGGASSYIVLSPSPSE